MEDIHAACGTQGRVDERIGKALRQAGVAVLSMDECAGNPWKEANHLLTSSLLNEHILCTKQLSHWTANRREY